MEPKKLTVAQYVVMWPVIFTARVIASLIALRGGPRAAVAFWQESRRLVKSRVQG